MKTRLRAGLALACLALGLPLAGCDVDTHSTATGLPKTTDLKPGDGPGGSGSISTERVNSGGPGAQLPAK